MQKTPDGYRNIREKQLKSNDSPVGFCHLFSSLLCAEHAEEGTFQNEKIPRVGQTQTPMLVIVRD